MVAPSKKPLAPTRAPVDVSSFFQTDEDVNRPFNGNILIHGKMKGGKSFVAASASEFFPKWDPKDPFKSPLPSPKKVMLEDMMWFVFDDGALDGLKECNLFVPNEQVIIFAKLLLKYKPSDALKKLIELSKEVCAKRKINFAVGDTISQLDVALLTYFTELTNDENNDFAPYKLNNAAHKKAHTEWKGLPCQKIWLCHSKNLMEGNKLAQDINNVNTKKAHRMVGSDTIVPDITGKSHTVYEGNASLIMVQVFVPEPGKDKTKGKRYLRPFGGEGFEGGNRFHQKLDFEEPSHLQYIFQKLMK